MRLLVVVNDPICTAGPLQERFEQRGYEAVVHRLVTPDQVDDPNVEPNLPNFTDFDAVLTLGARWSVTDPAQTGRWLDAALQELRRAHDAEVPVLGVCFGAQLLALAHGGSVRVADTPQLGWYTVETDDADLIGPGPWFEWHYDSITLPPEADEIARTGDTPQAFTVGRDLAVQFHPEVDEEIFEVWYQHGAVEALAELDMSADDVAAGIRADAEGIRQRAHGLVDAFLDRVAATS